MAALEAQIRRVQTSESRLVDQLANLDDSAPIVAKLNELAAARKAAEQEAEALRFQARHAERLSSHMDRIEMRMAEECARIETLSYVEKRMVLKEFGVQIVLYKADHSPRYEMFWNFDLGPLHWTQTGEGDTDDLMPAAIYTSDSGLGREQRSLGNIPTPTSLSAFETGRKRARGPRQPSGPARRRAANRRRHREGQNGPEQGILCTDPGLMASRWRLESMGGCIVIHTVLIDEDC